MKNRLRKTVWAGVMGLVVLVSFSQAQIAVEADRPVERERIDVIGRNAHSIGIGEDGGVAGTSGLVAPGQIPLGGTVEPAVAVDPNNNQRVAAASLFSLCVSTDGGGTSQPAVHAVVPGPHLLCGDPSVSYDLIQWGALER